MKKLKNYYSFLNESSADEYIGRRVKIREDSEFERQAFNNGDGYGIIVGTTQDEYYNYKIKWNNGLVFSYRRIDFDFVDKIEDNDDDNKIRWWRNGKLEESMDDPLSGTTNIKIKVDGDKNFVQRLIDNLSLIVKKRSTRPLRVKSITGYVNKETYARHNLYYSTYLEIESINKDFIIGEYKSVNNNIVIRINDEIVYDMDNKTFDNEILIDKIVSEYKRFLKDNRFIVNENAEEKDEIIYLKNLYDKDKYLFFISLELKKQIKDKYIKIEKKIDGVWKNITGKYVKVQDVTIESLAKSYYNWNEDHSNDIKLFCSNEFCTVVINVNEDHRILIKPSKIIISEEDPFGEEDWED